MALAPRTSTNTTIGFGTAALGDSCFHAVTWALQQGFRIFDTAEENEYWYNQTCVGAALQSFFQQTFTSTMACNNKDNISVCAESESESESELESWPPDIFIDTKIPPWELTSIDHIRTRAKHSRQTLVGFLDTHNKTYPLNVYYIHAPECWYGWHPQCENLTQDYLLSLRQAWTAMEAVVAIDASARRIGLSNVSPEQLLDIISFVDQRRNSAQSSSSPPPRYPDAVQTFADPLFQAQEIRSICRKYGIQFVSYSTLGTQHEGQDLRGLYNPVLEDPLIRSLADKYQTSTAEIVLSWAVQRHMSVIPRSTNLLHIQQLARLLHNATFVHETDLHLIDGLEYN